eukprot:CAMPEP_0170568396 /NCGR_PEP_ID=MMETSP0211-20121228/81166_1 /TAXON_ID=311385 /ORGANISM="Pseudokeronopsis sp., Strain OXSARD2" /LENGTH=136 /DNA_ID=CAMNT_0010890263 /DNA_START=816 /DNA_END=1223 /DNA_ORIENTATION=+
MILLLIPTLVAIFYPKVASVLGLCGAVAGLVIVYVLPVITYLKMVKTECEHPLLAKAIHDNQYKISDGTQNLHKSPQITLKNTYLKKQNTSQIERIAKAEEKPDLKRFYWACFTHSFIIIYGIGILIFTFINPIPD